MMEVKLGILLAINNTPLPTVLVVGGMLFIALAVGSQIGGRIELPAERQRAAGFLGILLLLIGIGFYFIPVISATILSGVQSTSLQSQSEFQDSNQAPSLESAPTQEVNSNDQTDSHCLDNVSSNRITSIEVGTEDQVVLSANEVKDEVFGIVLSENRETIVNLELQIFVENEIFKIQSALDQNCSPISEYENATRSSDKNTLQNWDSLAIRINNKLYDLRLGYSDGEVSARLISIVE